MYKNETLKSVSTFLCIFETLVEVFLANAFLFPFPFKVPLDSCGAFINDVKMNLTTYQQFIIILLVVIIRILLMLIRHYMLNKGKVLPSAFMTLFLISILGGIVTFFLKIDDSSPKEREKRFLEKEYNSGHITEEQYIERLDNLEQK